MSSNTRPNLAPLTGTNNKDEIYNRAWVKTGIAGPNEQLPSGVTGFNVSKVMRRTGARELGKSPMESLEDGDDYGVVRLNDWTEGWAQWVERNYGHRNAFLALSAFNGDLDKLADFAEETMDDAETVIEKVATKLTGGDGGKEVKSPVQGAPGADPQGIVASTPIMIDPDLVNTIRSAAPVLNWVDTVAQAGFYASYNIVSSREASSHGWSTEDEVRDVSSSSGSAFTLSNAQKAMKIWLDVLDISDFSARAQSTLDFMDLESTSVEIRTQNWATEEAEMVFYGDTDGGASDGGPQDSEAPDGLYKFADDANSAYTEDKSSFTMSGDKPLFEDIKAEVLGIVKNSAANIQDLGIVTSYDMFHALENEANVNVRLDSFDGSINFGRQPGVNTLSIAGVPILPDKNVRNHSFGGSGYKGNVGDVFIFSRPAVQRRALQPLSSTPLGKLGLADRMAMFQYEAPIDKSQGEFTRVLEGYPISSL